jgi:hypothetical protein
LADRLRCINDQQVISLARAQEVCGRLGEIIYFLDELAAIALVVRPARPVPSQTAAATSAQAASR